MGTARRCCTTRAARSCYRAEIPENRPGKGVSSYATDLPLFGAVRTRPGNHLADCARPQPDPTVRAACLRQQERIETMQQTHDETRSTNNEQHQTPSTGPDAKKARVEAVLPTALVGPAQQGREPCPIILPRIAIGMSVAPYVPVLPAAAPLAIEHRATLVLTPVTNEEQGEGAAQEPIAPPPPAVPGQERG